MTRRAKPAAPDRFDILMASVSAALAAPKKPRMAKKKTRGAA